MTTRCNMGDVRTIHRESATTRFTSFLPTVPRPPVHLYILYFLRTRYSSSRVSKPFLSLTDGQTVLLEPDVPLGLLTCDYAARLDLYLFHLLMPMYQFNLSSCHSWTLWLPL